MLKLFFFSTIFITLSVQAAEIPFGVFMVVKGDIKIQKAGQAAAAVKVGSNVMAGDMVISGADSRAKIVMNDRNVIYVSPKTKMTIEKYSDGKQGAKNVELRLDEGKVLNNVHQKYDGEKEKYLIKTPTAVAGVRGTSFFTSFDVKTRVTEVITQSGTVSFTSLDAKGAALGTVLVNKGEGSRAGTAAPPEAPKAVPMEQMKQVESDVAGEAKKNPPPSPASGGAGTGDGNKNQTGGGFRMNDGKDTAPDSVAKTPAPDTGKAPTTGTPLAPPPPVKGADRPRAGDQSTDAIRRGISEKKKVKVELNGR